MGIYIPGMKMPNTCYDCPFQIDECFGSIKCRYAKTWGSYSSRAVDCPLVPVPPHGRSIDAEKIYDAVEQRYRMSSGIEHRCQRDLLDLICAAPTIIPAESEVE